jgi:hypothetical protein
MALSSWPPRQKLFGVLTVVGVLVVAVYAAHLIESATPLTAARLGLAVICTPIMARCTMRQGRYGAAGYVDAAPREIALTPSPGRFLAYWMIFAVTLTTTVLVATGEPLDWFAACTMAVFAVPAAWVYSRDRRSHDGT